MRLFGIFYRLYPTDKCTSALFYSIQAAESYLWAMCGHNPERLLSYQRQYFVKELTWREREQEFINRQCYTQPVWVNERFWFNNYEIHKHHYAHVSLDDPSMIAFIESDAKGEADRQTRMKPGRYLKKYFGHVLTAKQIAYYSEWFATGLEPPRDIPGELKFATTEEEIIDVYARGPHSCMKGMECVRVYAAGDLAVAYVEHEGEVISRALCWPKKGAFGRCYPNEDDQDLRAQQNDLRNRLKALGWTSTYEDDTALDGARIQAIHLWGDTYVMPYLDHSARLDFHGDHFILTSEGEYGSDSTGGQVVITQPAWGQCDRCGDDIQDESDHDVVYGGWSFGSGNDAQIWCASCSSNHSFLCEATSERYSNRQRRWVNTETGRECWVAGYADENTFICDYDDDCYCSSLESEITPGRHRQWDEDPAAAPPAETAVAAAEAAVTSVTANTITLSYEPPVVRQFDSFIIAA